MDPKAVYLYALDMATKVVSQVEPEQMNLPTPDTEWTVHDLLQHITYELAWTADIVEGNTIAAVGDKYEGELFTADVVETWHRYEVLARSAVELCDVHAIAHLSYADKPVEEYLFEAGTDQLVHAWDLGQAIGVQVTFDEEVARLLYDMASARHKDLSDSGLFGTPIDVPESSSTQMKLLGLLGRSETWSQRSSAS
jgi:uncharacterized protein (TIGR03086 family)